jgi:hypothetical protein
MFYEASSYFKKILANLNLMRELLLLDYIKFKIKISK